MSKGASEKVSLELAFLEALDSIHADVDTSEIAEVQDWSRAVRGKFYGASIRDASDLSKLNADSPSALEHPNATNEIVSSPAGGGGIVLGGSSNVASHGSVQYAQMAIPQLIAACTSESSEGAWCEFILRFQPFIARTIARVVHRFGEVSRELVDDLSQEVYLRLCSDSFRTLRSFEFHHENSIYGFLKVVAANIAQDYFRRAATSNKGAAHEQKATKADHVVLEHVFSRDASSGPEGKILLEEIDTILKVHAHNPNFERDYKIFWLHFGQGLTAKAIAALPDVKLSVKGVESTLLRLTRRIRSALTQSKKDSAE